MSEPKKDPFKIEDPSILTYAEHKLIGSSIDREDMIANPFTPMAVLDGRRPIDVAAERLKVREIKSVDSEAFGMKFGELPVLLLGNISLKSGVVLDMEPVLTGKYNLITDEVSRKDLTKYPLTEAGRRKYGFAVLVGGFEKRN